MRESSRSARARRSKARSSPKKCSPPCSESNALNNLLGYPHKKWALWPQYISATPEEVEAVYERWRKAHRMED